MFNTHRLDVEGLMHGLHWVTMAELGGRGGGRAIIQHQGPGESISFKLVTHLELVIQYKTGGDYFQSPNSGLSILDFDQQTTFFCINIRHRVTWLMAS